ncbi:stress response small protein YobI [Escherichia coli]|nr:stress response small protein YobI [Escherichia coli]MBE0903512.1 stress response small protein YobI [Escherichia coli]
MYIFITHLFTENVILIYFLPI